MSKPINDGGPAWPTTPVSHGYSTESPGNGTGCSTGMTLRDYYAGQALNAFLLGGHGKTYGTIAEEAFNIADVMIEQRGKE